MTQLPTGPDVELGWLGRDEAVVVVAAAAVVVAAWRGDEALDGWHFVIESQACLTKTDWIVRGEWSDLSHSG